MRLALLLLLAGSAFAGQAHRVERLTHSEQRDIAEAQEALRVAKERLQRVTSEVKAAHGWVPVATGRCQWAEVRLWGGKYALITLYAACGEKPGQKPGGEE